MNETPTYTTITPSDRREMTALILTIRLLNACELQLAKREQSADVPHDKDAPHDKDVPHDKYSLFELLPTVFNEQSSSLLYINSPKRYLIAIFQLLKMLILRKTSIFFLMLR